jgi:hypothetical protein
MPFVRNVIPWYSKSFNKNVTKKQRKVLEKIFERYVEELEQSQNNLCKHDKEVYGFW